MLFQKKVLEHMYFGTLVLFGKLDLLGLSYQGMYFSTGSEQGST